jgi:hypothetical protein
MLPSVGIANIERRTKRRISMLCTWCRIEGEQNTKDENLSTSWLKLIPYCQVDKISLSCNLVEHYLSPILAKKKQ